MLVMIDNGLDMDIFDPDFADRVVGLVMAFGAGVLIALLATGNI